MKNIEQQTLNSLTKEFGSRGIFFSVPSRVNIVGEHIDYCGAKVLPFASEPRMYFAMNKSNAQNSMIHALDRDQRSGIGEGSDPLAYDWLRYFKSTINSIERKFAQEVHINVSFTSKIPVGAGMSSSSALCCGIIYGINRLYDLGMSASSMIELASEAEYGLGLQGGIMDQYCILFGKERSAMILDCNKRVHEYIDIDNKVFNFALLNSNIRHTLVDSEYNLRRKELSEALALLGTGIDEYSGLLSLKLGDIEGMKEGIHKKRLRHVISEIKRVDNSVIAIQNSDAGDLGRILWESHASLSKNYNVSCKEVDFLIEELGKHKGVLGARIMGGGFGGCVLMLLDKNVDLSFIEEIKSKYQQKYKNTAELIHVTPSEGIVDHS